MCLTLPHQDMYCTHGILHTWLVGDACTHTPLASHACSACSCASTTASGGSVLNVLLPAILNAALPVKVLLVMVVVLDVLVSSGLAGSPVHGRMWISSSISLHNIGRLTVDHSTPYLFNLFFSNSIQSAPWPWLSQNVF